MAIGFKMFDIILLIVDWFVGVVEYEDVCWVIFQLKIQNKNFKFIEYFSILYIDFPAAAGLETIVNK